MHVVSPFKWGVHENLKISVLFISKNIFTINCTNYIFFLHLDSSKSMYSIVIEMMQSEELYCSIISFANNYMHT